MAIPGTVPHLRPWSTVREAGRKEEVGSGRQLRASALRPRPWNQTVGMGVRAPGWRSPPTRLQKGPGPSPSSSSVLRPPTSIRRAQVPWALPSQGVPTSGPSACQRLCPEDSPKAARGGEPAGRRGRGCLGVCPETEEAHDKARRVQTLCLERASVTGARGHGA